MQLPPPSIDSVLSITHLHVTDKISLPDPGPFVFRFNRLCVTTIYQ